MTRVVIIEKKSKRVVATYEVHLRAANYAPTDFEYFNEAWRCAEEDGLVTKAKKADYTFALDDDEAQVRRPPQKH